MSRIMVLPGTQWQVPIMKKIKEMGHELYLINPSWVNGVSDYSDHFFVSDIFDYDKIISFCKNKKIDCAISDECDIATDIVARINYALGANCLSKDTAALFTNKYLMREFCDAIRVPSVPYSLCRTKEDALNFFDRNGASIIMKPLDSNASHGVFTIMSKDEIYDKFEESLSFSRNEKGVLLEKYIEGTEFTVDGIMTKYGHRTLAISEKEHYEHNQNIARSLYFSHENEKFDYGALRKINDSLMNATGLPFGLTHVEYKWSDGSYYLIEMAARGGGNLISAIIAPFMAGVDTYEYLINQSLHCDYDKLIPINYCSEKRALLNFLDFPVEKGKVVEISGIDYLEKESRIKAFNLNFDVGDYICKPENDSVRMGYYIICSESNEAFIQVMDNIQRVLRITVA